MVGRRGCGVSGTWKKSIKSTLAPLDKRGRGLADASSPGHYYSSPHTNTSQYYSLQPNHFPLMNKYSTFVHSASPTSAATFSSGSSCRCFLRTSFHKNSQTRIPSLAFTAVLLSSSAINKGRWRWWWWLMMHHPQSHASLS